MMEKIAVCGTLKKGGLWNNLTVKAQAKFISEDFIEISSIKNVKSDYNAQGDVYYPHVKFFSGTNKFLNVEIYEVSVDSIENYLDPLEEYTGGQDDPYTRKRVITESGEEVWVYDSNWELGKDIEKFFTHERGDKKYYNWIDTNTGK